MSLGQIAGQLLGLINVLEYGEEPSNKAIALAKEHGFIIVFGHSDDCLEIRGAVYDEVYSEPYLNKDGIIVNECEDDDCPYFKKAIAKAGKIKWKCCVDGITHQFSAVDCEDRLLNYWTFEQHEQGELYGIGFIAHLSTFEEEGYHEDGI